MTVLYEFGLERGDLTTFDSTEVDGGNTLEVSTSQKCHGTYAGHAVLMAFTNFAFGKKAFGSTQATVVARVRVRIAARSLMSGYYVSYLTVNNSDNVIAMMGIKNDGGTYKWHIRYLSSGSSFSEQVLSSPVPAVDTWYTLKLKIVIDGAAGEIYFYLEDTQQLSATGLDNDQYGDADRLAHGCYCPNGADGNNEIFFDCVVAADADVTKNDRHIEGLWVTGWDGGKDAWTKVGASPYLDAQDQPTNYVWCENAKKAECGDFEFGNSSETSNTLNQVNIHVYGQCATTGMDIWISGDNGSSFDEYVNPDIPASWGWFTINVSATLDTWTKLNAGEMYLKAANANDRHDIDAAFFEAIFTLPGVQQYTKEFTFDGLLQKTGTKDCTFDGWLQKTYTKDLTFDAYLKYQKTKELTFDGWLQATLTKELTFDGWLQQSFTKELTFDAYLTGVGTKDLTFDGWLQATLTKELTFDGWLLAQQTKPLTFDAYLKYVRTKDYTFDAFLLLQPTKALTFDAYLQAAGGTKEFSFDGWLLQQFSKQLSFDAFLKEIHTKGLTFDAFLYLIETKAFSFDAWLYGEAPSGVGGLLDFYWRKKKKTRDLELFMKIKELLEAFV